MASRAILPLFVLTLAVLALVSAQAAVAQDRGLESFDPSEHALSPETLQADGTLSPEQLPGGADGEEEPVFQVSVDPKFDERAQKVDPTAELNTEAFADDRADLGADKRISGLRERLARRAPEKSRELRRAPDDAPPSVGVFAPPRPDEGDLDAFVADEVAPAKAETEGLK